MAQVLGAVLMTANRFTAVIFPVFHRTTVSKDFLSCFLKEILQKLWKGWWMATFILIQWSIPIGALLYIFITDFPAVFLSDLPAAMYDLNSGWLSLLLNAKVVLL